MQTRCYWSAANDHHRHHRRLVVLIVGIRIVLRKMWADYSKPFFSFDEEQAAREVKELMADADQEIFVSQQLKRKS